MDVSSLRIWLAAAKIALSDPTLRAGVAIQSGLSAEGTSDAFSRLELEPTDDALRLLLARAADLCEPSQSVMVLLAGNIPTAPLRAVSWALAQAPHVLLRPSRRADLVAKVLVKAAQSVGLDVQIVASPDTTNVEDEVLELFTAYQQDLSAVHIYAGPAVMDNIVRRAPPNIRIEQHAHGFGVAIVEAGSFGSSEAALLADDIAAFDQKGCISPRFVFLVGPDATCRLAFSQLDKAMEHVGTVRPRGVMDEMALRQMLDVAIFEGDEVTERSNHSIIWLNSPKMRFFPEGRIVPVLGIHSVEACFALLAPWFRYLTALCIGGFSPSQVLLSAELSHVRMSNLGKMQRPELDGPVDLRVLKTNRSGSLRS